MEESFDDLCLNGKFDEAKELYKNCDIGNAFILACSNGHLSIAQWLYSLGDIDIGSAFRSSCENGHLDTAKWLYSIGIISIDDCSSAFRYSCCNGHLNVVQWLYSLDGTEYDGGFVVSCCYGHLDVAKWLYSRSVGADLNYIFRCCIMTQNLTMCQWLYSLGRINIHMCDDIVFILSCGNNNLDLVKWLLLVDRFDNELVDRNLPYQLYEYAFYIGYVGIDKMKSAYINYKNNIMDKIKEKNNINIFEINDLVDIIITYV